MKETYMVLCCPLLDSDTEEKLADEIKAVFEHHNICVRIEEPVSFEDAVEEQEDLERVHQGNYVDNVLRTESCDMEPIKERLSEEGLMAALNTAMETFTTAAEIIDVLKKYIFYGKQDWMVEQLVKAAEFDDVSSEHDDSGHVKRFLMTRNIRMMHATVGMATEAGELMEMLQDHIMYGAEFDEVNAVEEIGDSFWYQGVAIDVLGTNVQQVMQTNIDKLRARYPDKFNEAAAINRDLKKEHAILANLDKELDDETKEELLRNGFGELAGTAEGEV